MQDTRFETPVIVKSGPDGAPLQLRSAAEASDFLLNKWPGKRTAKHRAALQACSDTISSGKSAMTARRAFVAAAREVDVLVTDRP